jgi:hypothetical protein
MNYFSTPLHCTIIPPLRMSWVSKEVEKLVQGTKICMFGLLFFSRIGMTFKKPIFLIKINQKNRGENPLNELSYLDPSASFDTQDVFMVGIIVEISCVYHSMLRQDLNKKSKARELNFLKI